MENNAKSATPVNVEGFGPGLPPLDVTIVAPLPLPVELVTPLPVPVIIIPSTTYPVKRQAYSQGTPVVQAVLSSWRDIGAICCVGGVDVIVSWPAVDPPPT